MIYDLVSQEKQVRRRAEKVRHERRREEISAQIDEEREVMRSSLAERHKQAVERYHAQCEMRRSQIKHAGYVLAMVDVLLARVYNRERHSCSWYVCAVFLLENNGEGGAQSDCSPCIHVHTCKCNFESASLGSFSEFCVYTHNH